MSALYVTVKGSRNKPALVLLHGFMGTGLDWGQLTETLSQDYYCVAIDLPGHGMSQDTLVSRRSGFAQTHKRIEITLQRLDIHSYALLGYSLGGRIAFYHATRKPKGLKALLVESAHPGLKEAEKRLERLKHDHQWAKRLRQEPFEQVLADWYQQPVFSNLSQTQRQEQIRRKTQLDPRPLANMLEATSLAEQPPLSDKLAKLSLPIALFNGRRDNKFCKISEQLSQRLKQPQRLMFDNAGHNIHFEQPELFTDRVRQVLDHIYR